MSNLPQSYLSSYTIKNNNSKDAQNLKISPSPKHYHVKLEKQKKRIKNLQRKKQSKKVPLGDNTRYPSTDKIIILVNIMAHLLDNIFTESIKSIHD